MTMKFTAELLTKLDVLQIVRLTDDFDIDSVDHIIDFYNFNRQFDKAVLNAVLIKSIKYKRNNIPNKVYLDITLNSFIKDKITTPTKAARSLNNNHEYYKAVNTKTNKPAWLKEYVDEIKNMD